MRKSRIGSLVATAALCMTGIMTTGVVTIVPGVAASPPTSGTAASPNYPVPYTFLANIAAAPNGPNTPPPGANDWTCRPSAAHPEPVVLVHGLLANETDNWQTISPLLADNGYCVYSLTYGTDPNFTTPPLDESGGLVPMEQSAAVLGAFVNRVLAATGAPKVDLVGHSEGATMPDYYINSLEGRLMSTTSSALPPSYTAQRSPIHS